MLNPFTTHASAALIFVACLLDAGSVVAHAVITESSLRNQTLHPLKATRILLNFNSGVELSLSKFDLVRKGDTHEAISIQNGSRPGQIILSVPPLAPGNYAIHYKVFAADGHLTEDVIRFSVAENPNP